MQTWGSIGNRMHHILTSFSRNNLYISADGSVPIWTAHDCNQPQYCLPNNYESTWMTDVDYDGFDWGDSPEALRWNNNRQRFKDLQSFAEAVGIEKHGVRVRKEEIFADWSIPVEPTRVEPQHLTLKANSEAVDAGAIVPNIADDFVSEAPDLGAYEYGRQRRNTGRGHNSRHHSGEETKMTVLRILVTTIILSPLCGQTSAAEPLPKEPVEIGTAPQFLFDQYIIDNHWAIKYKKETVRRVFHQPEKYEHNPVIAGEGGYICVLKDERRWPISHVVSDVGCIARRG